MIHTGLRPGRYAACPEVAAFEAALEPGSWGACALFTGAMRGAHAVERMELEHYPGMTERQLQELAEEAVQRYDIQHVLLLHRVGTVLPGETIVLVASWSAHRAAAFQACRYMLETLKTSVTFWKKEYTPAGARWVPPPRSGVAA